MLQSIVTATKLSIVAVEQKMKILGTSTVCSYLSPELCSDKPYNDKSDIWALGVVLYECCTGAHPFDAENQGDLMVKILRGRYKAVDATYSDALRDIVRRCLSRSTSIRPTAQQLLALPVRASSGD